MSTKLRLPNNPQRIVQTSQQQLLAAAAAASRGRGGASSPPSPVWLHAVRMFPPAPPPLPYVVPSRVGHFGATEAAAKTAEKQIQSVQSPHRTQRAALRPVYTKTAPAIVYPEDALRKQFYNAHPFELLRPRVLIENVDALAGKSSSESLVPEEVSGETVVQTAVRYASTEKIPLSDAYNRALSEFYAVRREQEQAQHMDATRNRLELLKKLDALKKLQKDLSPEAAQESRFELTTEMANIEKMMEHKQVSWFKERESEQLAESKAFLDVLDKEREEKRQLQDKMSQFDSRNMKKDA
ncbi:mitochondrial ribosomal small subunit component [Chytriomyces hyalinus]|nr:mitochondrial ribosomal small subunit component [Chytriomyces hyalinus]